MGKREDPGNHGGNRPPGGSIPRASAASWGPGAPGGPRVQGARGAEFEVELPDPQGGGAGLARGVGASPPSGVPLGVSGAPAGYARGPDPQGWRGTPSPGRPAGAEHGTGTPGGLSSGGAPGASPASVGYPQGQSLQGPVGEGAEPGMGEGGAKRGISAGGAFGMAMLAQLVTLGLLAALVWAFPRETRDLVQLGADRLHLEKILPVAPSSENTRSSAGEAGFARLAILELEDRAIYRGERGALEQLRRMGRELDAGDARFDAVQASLIRVRQSYQLSQDELPGPLDPREILPGVETERDLPVAAVVDVLRNRRQTSVKRQRAAYLLGNERQSTAAKSALFHAVQDDPHLGVVRQAFQAFQGLTGYPGQDFFDADAVDRWWARNAASFMGQHSEN